LLIDCPARKGLVAAVADFLYAHGANILHADQHRDNELGLFLLRAEWDLTDVGVDADDLARLFTPRAERFGMR
jgi:formyltetrahydrofolate deformylase